MRLPGELLNILQQRHVFHQILATQRLSILVTYFLPVIAHHDQKWLIEEFLLPYSARGIETLKRWGKHCHRQPEQGTERSHLQPHSESRENHLKWGEAINLQCLWHASSSKAVISVRFPNIHQGPGFQTCKPMGDIISHSNDHTERSCWEDIPAQERKQVCACMH